jgi:nuclear-control-of-ATPase protein 2
MSDLEDVISSLSVTSKSQPILPPEHVIEFISKLSHPLLEPYELLSHAPTGHALEELTWLAVAKAAVQTLGLILKSFLDQNLLLSDEIFYWDSVLGSYWYTGVYTIQTSPFRIWHRLMKARPGRTDRCAEARFLTPVSFKWEKFYDSIKRCYLTGNLHALRARILSPFVTAKFDMRRKREKLKTMKDSNANGIGLLMKQCFPIQINDDSHHGTKCRSDGHWRNMVCRSVVLMEKLLQNLPSDSDIPDFGEGILSTANKEIMPFQTQVGDMCTSQAPERVAERLHNTVLNLLPAYNTHSLTNVKNFGRPPLLVRYWLPWTAGLLTASTSLRILVNRRHELIQWIANVGETTIEFWSNWVIDPTRRLIGTIKHDEKSEIALMSKNSLEADRASLERMVVDFILDRGEPKHGDSSLDINSIANKVREGDLTPVLRAYEKDLRTPFVGTLRGDLVRALLIQIQKTKVDVEIAIGGIDALLKSQELVFGYAISLTQCDRNANTS